MCLACYPDTKEIPRNEDKHNGFLSPKHDPKHFQLIENRACSDMLTLCYRAGWKMSWCHLQHVFYTLTTTSNHSQLKLEWLGNELRNVLFRGRWSGGNKAGKARRGFCFRLREALKAPLHCGWAGSIILWESRWQKWQQKQFLNISSFPEYISSVHLSLRPLCASNGKNAAFLAHVFFGLPLQTMIDWWWYFHNSAIVCGCNVKEQVFL